MLISICKSVHFPNIIFLVIRLMIFHLDKSGSDINDEHP